MVEIELEDWWSVCERRLALPQGAARLHRVEAICDPQAAWTTGRDVFMSASAFRGPVSVERTKTIIAHELAHVAQCLRGEGGRPISCELGLELEADAAAQSLMEGRPFRCRERADPAATLHWNRFGHYYTVLVLCLHAGWPYSDACKAAYMAQLPDLAFEFDAPTQSLTTLGLYMFRELSPELRNLATRAFVALVPELGTTAPYVMARDYVDSAKISIGLHSLTGRNIAIERQFRKDILRKTAYNSPAFGLGLHALGDSFAHCDLSGTAKMYTPLVGHALDGHDPDCTGINDAGYIQYLRALWDVVWDVPAKIGRTNAGFHPKWPFPRDLKNTSDQYKYKMLDIIMRRMGMYADTKDDDPHEYDQINDVRAFIHSNWNGTGSSTPSYDAAPFGTLKSYYSTGVSLEQCLDIARGWAEKIPDALALAKSELDSNYLRRRVEQKFGRYLHLRSLPNALLQDKMQSLYEAYLKAK